MTKIENLIEKLNNGKIILLDGGMGTELQRRGVNTSLPLWSAKALLNSPQTIKEIHHDYLLAGAEIIETNTFRTNHRTLAKAGLAEHDEKLTKLAVDLAKEAVAEFKNDKKILIGGVQTTLEDCYCPELVDDEKIILSEHRRWSKNLKKAGVDFIFLETFNTIREATTALKTVSETGLKATISFVCNDQAKLLSGEPLEQAVKIIEIFKPIAILINCLNPSTITKILPVLKSATNLPIGAYGNGLGQPHDDQGWIFDQSGKAVKTYVNEVQKWLAIGAQLVGGCCGTNPEYIQAIAKQIKK